MKRWPAILLGVSLGLLLALAVAWRSPAASAWLLQRAAVAVPGELQLQGISGSLADGLAVARVEYRLDGLSVAVRELRIVVGWSALFKRELWLRRLLAGELIVRQQADAGGGPVAALPEISLPLALRVDTLRLDRLALDIGALTDGATQISGRARWAGPVLSVGRFEARRGGLDVEASGELRFAGRWPLAFGLRWRLADADVSGEGEVAGDLDRLVVRQLVRLPDPLRVTGAIEQPLGDLQIDLQATWDQLGVPAAGSGRIVARDGRLALAGRPDDYRAELSTRLAVDGLSEITLVANGNGDLEALTAEKLDLRSGFGRLSGTARARFSPLSLHTELAGRDWDPEQFAAGWPGRIDFRAVVDADSEGNLSARISELDGTVREVPLSGGGVLRRTGRRLAVEQASLRVGANRLSLRLVSSPALDGEFDLDAPDLAELWPGLAGRVTGSGRISGSPDEPQVAAGLAGAGLAYQGQSLEALDLRVLIGADRRVDLSLLVSGLASGELVLGDLQASADGLLDDFELELALRNGPLQGVIAGPGTWDGDRVAQVVARGELEAGGAGRWSLNAPFELLVSASGVTAGAHCWLRAPSRLCVDEFQFADGLQQVTARLTGLPLALLAGLLDDGVEVDGAADVALMYRRRDGAWRFDLDWLQRDTVLRFEGAADDPLTAAVDTARLSLRADESAAELRGRVAGEYGLVANFGGRLLEPLSPDAGLDLRLIAQLPDLAAPGPLLARYLPLERIGGRVDVDLAVGGSRRSPRLRGYARLTEGRAFVPLAGIDLQAVELSLVPGSGDQLGLLAASAVSGDGRLTLDGALRRDDARGLYAEATLRGEAFQAVRFPNQSVYVSPDLSLLIDRRLVDVQGTVQIPRARIEVEQLPASAQTPSGDIVVHYEQEPVEPRQGRFAYGVIGNLDLRLGDDVVFRGFGLDTRLAGRLQLARASATEPFRADGSLRTVGGRFTAARRELSIDRGVLIFTGPLDDPSVDVRAVREVRWEGRDYRAGVLLTGPVSDIRTEVFGEPAMSETDALSFLVLGRPASDVGGAAGAELSGTAVALGLVGLLPFTEQLQDSLMLDEISFTGGGDDASVIAGKRLSDDIFVRYTYGLFDRVGTFLVRYEVGRGFSLEAGSGREQTLEMIYSIDR